MILPDRLSGDTLISFYKQPVYKQQYSNLKIDKQLDTQIVNA